MTVYSIFVTVLTVVFGFLCGYLKTKTTLIETAKYKINEAERLYESYTKAGKEKFEWVVNSLFALVPEPLKTIFSREIIGIMVQSVFDTMAEYAVKQLDKVVDNND